MTAPRDPHTPDPAHVQATDEILDRLGRRVPEPRDVVDPVFAALSDLADDVDAAQPPDDAAFRRLVDVMAGRPVWLLDAATSEDPSDVDADQEMILLDDPSWDGDGRRIIDLTDGATVSARVHDDVDAPSEASLDVPSDAVQEDDEREEIAAVVGSGRPSGEVPEEVAGQDGEGDDTQRPVSLPAARRPEVTPPTRVLPVSELPDDDPAAQEGPEPAVAEARAVDAAQSRGNDTGHGPGNDAGKVAVPLVRPIPIQPGPGRRPQAAPARRPDVTVTEERWERVLRQMALPVAAAITIFTVGGGVTAALTGDPMAPIDGVTRVVDELSGEQEPVSYSVLQNNIKRAEVALQEGRVDQARQIIASARKDLGEVSEDERKLLSAQIATVSQQIEAVTPAPVVPPTALPSGEPSEAATTPPPQATSSAVATPTETPTATSTPSVTPTPTPTDSPSTPAVDQSVESTPVAVDP